MRKGMKRKPAKSRIFRMAYHTEVGIGTLTTKMRHRYGMNDFFIACDEIAAKAAGQKAIPNVIQRFPL